MKRLNGEDATINDGLALARQHIGKIFVWALITATVGMILRTAPGARRHRRADRDRARRHRVERAHVLRRAGPAVRAGRRRPRRSSARRSIFRQRWGEQFIGNATIGLAIFLMAIPVVLVGGADHVRPSPLVGVPLLVVAIGALMAIGAACSGVFNAALYRFATTGEASSVFSLEDMNASFRPQKRPARTRRVRRRAVHGFGASAAAPAQAIPPTRPDAGPRPTCSAPHRLARVPRTVRPRRVRTMGKELYEIGELPPIGEVPAQMHAQLVRPDRFGEPEQAIQDEVIDVPELGPHDALVMVMAGGVNFNNVWAARGMPVDVTKTQARWGEPTDFHIVGSDASGVVYAVGSDVTNVKVGDRVVVHAGQWDPDDPEGARGPGPGARGFVPRLGLRHVLGLVRAVHQGAGAPVPAEGRAPHVGGGGGAHAHRRHRVPDAVRLAAEHRAARRRRPGVGRLRRARLARDPARRERRRPRGRGRGQRREGRVLQDARRGRATSTARTSRTGASRRRGTRRSGRPGSTARRRSARRSGRRSARRTSPRIVFEHPGAGHDPHVELRLRPRRHDRDLRGHHAATTR